MKVITFGVFDYFHYGHLKLFEQAKKYGNYLVVAIQDSNYILKYKPEAKILYSTQQRIELISALKIVDKVIVYTDVDKTIQTIDFDVFCRGEDQNHEGFMKATEYALKINKKVEILKRTKGISSTDIKTELRE